MNKDDYEKDITHYPCRVKKLIVNWICWSCGNAIESYVRENGKIVAQTCSTCTERNVRLQGEN